MRIISGKYKGRTIKMSKGIRPTQNKVRKALFDILGDIEGLSFLELFAGSGAVGIEALSWGAKEVVFVEKDKRCIEKIKQNLSVLAFLRSRVLTLDALVAIKQLSESGDKLDIIFLDPPYYKKIAFGDNSKRFSVVGKVLYTFPYHKRKVPRHYASRSSTGDSGSKVAVRVESLSKKTLQTLGAYDILAPNGFIVVQHFKKDSLPDNLGVLTLFRQAKYGDTILSFYRKVNPKSQ